MRVIAGREVYETVEELTHPHTTALLLLNVQNDYLAPNGVDSRRGDFREARTRRIVPNMRRILTRARARGVTVVLLRSSRAANPTLESPSSLRWRLMKRGYQEDERSTIRGTWGWQVIEALAPLPGEIVINKYRSSGFHGTELEIILGDRGITSLILVGVSTHGCVEATARDAELRDYYVTVVEDCVGSYDDTLHQAALVVMRSRYEVIDSARLLRAWKTR
ncbi:MAG: cysteine hydrolase family protein [Burkholderiales bacterium]